MMTFQDLVTITNTIIEIDNKYFYDFIGPTNTMSDTQSIATFFQVLDPPLLEMMNDITTKSLDMQTAFLKAQCY